MVLYSLNCYWRQNFYPMEKEKNMDVTIQIKQSFTPQIYELKKIYWFPLYLWCRLQVTFQFSTCYMENYRTHLLFYLYFFYDIDVTSSKWGIKGVWIRGMSRDRKGVVGELCIYGWDIEDLINILLWLKNIIKKCGLTNQKKISSINVPNIF